MKETNKKNWKGKVENNSFKNSKNVETKEEYLYIVI